MSKILVPINFSANARNALQYAIGFATENNLNIKLLHVIQIDYPAYGQVNPLDPMANPTDMSSITPPTDLKKEEEQAKIKLKELIKELKISAKNVEFETKIRSGHYPDVVINESNNPGFDFLILTSQRKEEKLSGVNAESIDAIVEGSDCPTIIISPDVRYKPISKVLYATDFHEEDIESLKHLSKYCKRFGAGILALHVTNNPGFKEKIEEEGFNELLSQKVGFPCIKVLSITSEKVAKGIANYAHNTEADFIALLKENKSFWKSLFSKSTAEKLIKNTNLPIIVFNQSNKG